MIEKVGVGAVAADMRKGGSGLWEFCPGRKAGIGFISTNSRTIKFLS